MNRKATGFSNIILLLLAIIGYALFLRCVFFYCTNSEEIATSMQSIVLNIVVIGVFFGFIHIVNIAATIVTMNIKKRAMSLVCMGTTLVALFSTWLWNFWLTVDNVNMLNFPIFVAILLGHAVFSVVLCVVKFAKRF